MATPEAKTNDGGRNADIEQAVNSVVSNVATELQSLPLLPKTASDELQRVAESARSNQPLLNKDEFANSTPRSNESPKWFCERVLKVLVSRGSALLRKLFFQTSPRMRVIAFAILALVTIGLLLGSVQLCLTQDEPLPVPALPPTTQYSLGEFIITVTDAPTDTPNIRVVHRAQPEHAVFESLLGVPLISAMVPNDIIHGGYRYGHFHIEQRDTDICDTIAFETVMRHDDELVAKGSLGKSSGTSAWYAFWANDDSSCASLRFSMTLALVPREPRQLDLSVALSSETGPLKHKRTVVSFAREEGEAIYGFGTQYNIIDARGHRMPILCREQGIGRGDQPLSWALNKFYHGAGGSHYESLSCVPHLATSRSRGLFLNNADYVVFDMTRPNTVSVEVRSAVIRGRLITAADPLDYLTEVTKLTGRMRPLPDWAHSGAIVSLQGGRQRILDKVDSMLGAGVQLAGIWVQDWCGRRQQTIMGNTYDRVWWNWEVDRTWYQDWDDMMDILEEKGVHMMTYINPFLANPSHDEMAGERWDHNYYNEALDGHYLLKDITDKTSDHPFIIEQGPGVTAAMMDFDKADAVDFYKKIIRDNMIKRRQKGWMGDFGEYYPLVGNMDRDKSHNNYPYQWARLQREIIDATPAAEDVVFFSRSASAKSPGESTLFWVGDQMMSWSPNDGFPSAIVAMITSGLSGHTLTHSDTGGYNSISIPLIMDYRRTPELLHRWTESSVFSAVLRTHEGNIPKGNSQVYDTEIVKTFANYSKLFKSLYSYRKVLMQEAYEKGWPLVRHMWLHFPDDRLLRAMGDQYMFGADLLVKPVMTPGAESVKVYLPKGIWTNVWSQAKHTSIGAAYEVNSPLGQPPVFVRSGDHVHSKALRPFLKLACEMSPSCQPVQ